MKVLALLGFVVACFAIFPRSAAHSHLKSREMHQYTPDFCSRWLAPCRPSLSLTMDGTAPSTSLEEDEDPARNLPRSSIAGIIACIAVFLLVNAALLHVLPIPQLAASKMPAADAAMAVFGGRGKQFILIVSMVAAISTINALIIITPRILFAISRDGYSRAR